KRRHPCPKRDWISYVCSSDLTPGTYFLVPSIGSMTHWRPEVTGSPPNSSPTTSSCGRAFFSSARSFFSHARSASETGVISGFSLTDRSAASKRCMVTTSAWPASSSANPRSSLYLPTKVVLHFSYDLLVSSDTPFNSTCFYFGSCTPGSVY